jgi:hypothetical protein
VTLKVYGHMWDRQRIDNDVRSGARERRNAVERGWATAEGDVLSPSASLILRLPNRDPARPEQLAFDAGEVAIRYHA